MSRGTQREVGVILGAQERYQDSFDRYRRGLQSTRNEAQRTSTGIVGAFNNITSAADALNGKLGAVDKFVNRTFKATAAGITAYAGVVTRDLLHLNAGISKINTLYDQTTQSQKRMTKDVIDTWRLIPQNFSQITQGMYDAISASLDPENAASAARKFGMGAVAGNTNNISAVVKAVMGTKNAYGLDDSVIQEIMDVQFSTIKSGIVEYEELAAALGTGLMPSAQASGVGYKQVYAALAQLTKNNMPANVSATSLIQLFNKFTDTKTLKDFREFGVNIQDSKGHTRDLLAIVQDLFNIFEQKGMTSEARKGFLKEILGSDEASRAILPLIQNIKDFEQTYDSVVNKSKGATREAYADQMDNLVTLSKVVLKGITGVGIDYAMQFEPFIKALAEPFKKKAMLEMDIADISEQINLSDNPYLKQQLILERDLMIGELKNIDLTPIEEWKNALDESVNNLKNLNPELAKMAEAVGGFVLSFLGEEGAEKRESVATGAKVLGGAYLGIKGLALLNYLGGFISWIGNITGLNGSGRNAIPGAGGASLSSMIVNAGVVHVNGGTGTPGSSSAPSVIATGGGSLKSIISMAIPAALSAFAVYYIGKNALDKNEEYASMELEERNRMNQEIMKESKAKMGARGNEKYSPRPARSRKQVEEDTTPRKIVEIPKVIKPPQIKAGDSVLASMKDTMDKMKNLEVMNNITNVVPVQVDSKPNVNVKVYLDNVGVPSKFTTSTVDNFRVNRVEQERIERRLGGILKY